ncbi:hypothetical protein QFZ37_000062 [Chryseobacterium ginsenosidimutans]|nr:hypothetical protein [Chryseobacterium ginsenosidimutans]
MKDIFTLRNFWKSLTLGLVGLLFFYLIRLIFKRENEGWIFYLLMFITFFFINFVLGHGNKSWHELFKNSKKLK